MEDTSTPADWDVAAHRAWLGDQRLVAIQTVIATLNQHGAQKPLPLLQQLTFYLYLVGDYPAAAQLLTMQHKDYPDSLEILLNLGACQTRAHDYANAQSTAEEYLKLRPNDPAGYDILAEAHSNQGNWTEAARAGTRALTLKDTELAKLPKPLTLPARTPQAFLAAQDKPNVIAFSLWGTNPRYLRGALDNALQSASIYPAWRMRVYADDTVPTEIIEALKTFDVEVIPEGPGQTFGQRLCWRFKVANDTAVGRFLIRDIDAVINPREASAVNAWMSSTQWFHVMRDWWTHTDLILAGMWGGVAGLLPDLQALFAQFEPIIYTANIDQYFLRKCVWPLIRDISLVHDRCFTPAGAHPWPSSNPAGNLHVGQCVFSTDAAAQAERLQPWIAKLPSLQLTP